MLSVPISVALLKCSIDMYTHYYHREGFSPQDTHMAVINPLTANKRDQCQQHRRLSVRMCPWSTKPVISSTGVFVAIANNTLYGSKLYIFLLCQKSLEY